MCGENQILVTELKSDLEELDSEKALEISEVYFAYCLFKKCTQEGYVIKIYLTAQRAFSVNIKALRVKIVNKDIIIFFNSM